MPGSCLPVSRNDRYTAQMNEPVSQSPAATTHIETLYAEVALSRVLPGTLRGVYTYLVPPELTADVQRGVLVVAPIQRRLVPGIVLGLTTDPPDFSVRPLHSVPEPRHLLPSYRLDLAEWLARETASSVYAAVSPFLPPGLQTRMVETYVMVDNPDRSPAELTPAQRRVMALLAEYGTMSIDQLRAATGKSLSTVMEKLQSLDLVHQEIRVDQSEPARRTERFVRLLDGNPALTARSPRQSRVVEELTTRARFRRDGANDLVALPDLRSSVDVDAQTLTSLEKKGIIEVVELGRSEAPVPSAAPAPVLTPEQAAAWSVVERALFTGDPTPNLLFGVTGSGKTEIYLRGVAWCLRHGRGAIVLVPEIGLATQVVRRFVDRFPGQVAVLHSQLTESQRHDIWRALEANEYRVVVGPRSALFAPIERLGLIVLDEEHEGTYKQESEPRYHARALAIEMARRVRATVVLGSATPSIESTWHAANGDYRRISLPDRVNPVGRAALSGQSASLELPEVEIVDLKLELHDGNTSLVSRALDEAVRHALSRQEQAIVLLNRRGTSTVVLCRDCGHRVVCSLCDIPMVFHRDRIQMVCHRCDYREPPPQRCPDCGGRLDYFGAGTQRVEDEVRATYPDSRVLRWDQDSIRQHGGYEAMLARVENRDVDIVVGTQMVAKGFDLPHVTAIGVIQADTMLHLPDFRSSERTFQLLTQVAGRAGRRAPGSRVVVQTYTPGHYAVTAAAQHDYDAFYTEEIDFRRQHHFPPFVRLARFLYRHDQERAAAIEAEMMARELVRHARKLEASMDLLGPTPAFAAKVAGKHQWQIVLRSRDLDRLLDELPIRAGWVVDVDPQSML